MEDEQVWLEMGKGETGREAEQPDTLPAAIIYLPDPDTRRGWYGRWVKRQPEQKQARHVGFTSGKR